MSPDGSDKPGRVPVVLPFDPMKRFFHDELEHFRTHIVLMGEKAIGLVRLSMQALLDRDPDLIQDIYDRDDEIDRLEVEIDSEAIRYISLRQPVASELRLLAVGMKTGHDLERVGDEATSIAKRAAQLSGEMPILDFRRIPEMGEMVTLMLEDTLSCLLEEDESLALSICQRDKRVDELNRENFRDYTQILTDSPDQSRRALELMFISKSLERIGDHATNIAEEVVFLLRGQDVRHTEEVKNRVARGL